MNNIRYTPDNKSSLDGRSVSELKELLERTEGYGKTQVILALARMSHTQPELMQIVLEQAASPDNQSTTAAFNDSVAMIAAYAVVDDGQPGDIAALKTIVSEWNDPYQIEDFYWALSQLEITI